VCNIVLDLFLEHFDDTVPGARGGRGEEDGRGGGGGRDGVVVDGGKLVVVHMLEGRVLKPAGHLGKAAQERAVEER